MGEVASVSGRYYTMDRDNRWDRVGKLTSIELQEKAMQQNPTAGIRASTMKDATDEFVVPFVVTKRRCCNSNNQRK